MASGGIGGTISAIRDLKAVTRGETQARHRAQMEALYDTVVDKLDDARRCALRGTRQGLIDWGFFRC